MSIFVGSTKPFIIYKKTPPLEVYISRCSDRWIFGGRILNDFLENPPTSCFWRRGGLSVDWIKKWTPTLVGASRIIMIRFYRNGAIIIHINGRHINMARIVKSIFDFGVMLW